MYRSYILSTLLLGASLAAPIALKAQDESRKETTTTTTTTTETKRYYDPEEKVYRNWTADEDRAYRRYLQENHRDYVEFPKVKTTEQREYWRWRHGHPESVTVTTEKEEKR
jgi:Ni/Co efflux regulator RcnB